MAKKKSRQDELFDKLRAVGLRKQAARTIAAASEKADSKRLRKAVEDLRGVLGELESRVGGALGADSKPDPPAAAKQPAARKPAAKRATPNTTRSAAAAKRSAAAKKAAATRAANRARAAKAGEVATSAAPRRPVASDGAAPSA